MVLNHACFSYSVITKIIDVEVHFSFGTQLKTEILGTPLNSISPFTYMLREMAEKVKS